MRDVWLTARYEMRTTLGRRSFWLTTFLLPAAVLVLVFVPQVFRGGEDTALIPGTSAGAAAIGYVDPGGVLRTPATDLPPGLVQAFPDETEARSALSAAEIERYYVISDDYLASGRLTVVQPRYQPLRALDGRQLITYVINTGITGNEALSRLLLDPTPGAQSRSLAPGGPTTSSDATSSYFLPYLLMFVLYMALVMTSGYMLQSVSREKENRTAEVLLVALRPRDLMMGKIAGLSAVGLLQVAVWLAVIFAVLLTGKSFAGFDLSIDAGFAARVIPWTLVYFLLGYLVYSSVYAVLGVLAPTARDANQFVILAIVPLVLPLLLLSVFADAPNGAAATALSLFPLTSPVAMIARLGATSVPWWQLVAGAVALAAVAYLFMLLAGRFFRAENLLSARALTWTRLTGALRSRRARAGAAGTAGPDAAAADLPGPSSKPQPTPSRKPTASARQRTLMLVLVAAVMVILGIVEYARGESTGLVIAIAGVVIAGAAYLRQRRDR